MAGETQADAIQVQLRCDYVIVVEEKDVLGRGRVDRRVAPHADTHVVFRKVNDLAVSGRFGIFLREPQMITPVVHDDDLGITKMLADRFDQPMAGPGTVDRLDAKGDVTQLDRHGPTRICEAWD